jgi:hypothetical protein
MRQQRQISSRFIGHHFITFFDRYSVQFIRFLQQSVEMGKTSAEMSIERSAARDHNVPSGSICLLFYHPPKGTSNEQL